MVPCVPRTAVVVPTIVTCSNVRKTLVKLVNSANLSVPDAPSTANAVPTIAICTAARLDRNAKPEGSLDGNTDVNPDVNTDDNTDMNTEEMIRRSKGNGGRMV